MTQIAERLTESEQTQLRALLARLVGGVLPARFMVQVVGNDSQLSARPYTILAMQAGSEESGRVV
jgi:hypothetical protein